MRVADANVINECEEREMLIIDGEPYCPAIADKRDHVGEESIGMW